MSGSTKNDGTPSQRKFKGFGYYIMSNEKLSKKNRQTLLVESEKHLLEVTSSLSSTMSTDDIIRKGVVSELDPNLNDYELLDQWNTMYDQFGYLMTDFRSKWEKDHLSEDQPKTETPNIITTLIQRIDYLELEVSKLHQTISKLNSTNTINF